MTSKPLVLLVDSEDSSHADQGNQSCLALSFCLQNDLGCEVIQIRNCYDAMEDFQRVKTNAPWITIAIVAQTPYMDTYLEFLQQLRSVLRPTISINVLPDFSDGWDKAYKGDAANNIHSFGYGAELLALIQKAVCQYELPENCFGVQSREDHGILTAQLEAVYKTHYLSPDDERNFAIPDHNTAIVAEALRIRLLPSANLKAEFDDALPRQVTEVKQVPSDLYRNDVRRIKGMTAKERRDFRLTILEAQGYEEYPGGGVRKIRTSYGDKVLGFSIHLETLQYVTSEGFGLHSNAKRVLADRVEEINDFRQKLRGGGSADSENRRYSPLVDGLILLDVEGFNTPLLVLLTGFLQPPDIKKLARFITSEQKYIPIDPNGQLLRG